MGRGKWWKALWFAIGCLIGLALVVATRMGLLNEVLASLALWFVFGLALGVVCHEAGHVLAALVGSLPIRLVSIGFGPRLSRFRIGDARIDLRLLPFGGFVVPRPRLEGGKWWMLIFVSGGVLANAALIGLVVMSDALGAVPDWAVRPLSAIVLAQVLLIVSSLVPREVTIDGNKVGTDGLQLLRLLRSPGNGQTNEGVTYGKMLAGYAGPAAGPHDTQIAISPASQRIAHHIFSLDIWWDNDALQECRESLEHELKGNLPREEELLVLDWLVTRGLTSGDSAFRDRLDHWSQQALQLGPDINTLRGSRGAVLVELGRWEEGKSMLSKVVAAEGTFDALMTQIYLARAEHALGNIAAAKMLTEAARKTSASLPESDATSKLLRRLEAELGLAPAHRECGRVLAPQ